MALANGTDYGLVAGVWTRDGARAAAHRARACASARSSSTTTAPAAASSCPSAAYKQSGYGREKGFEALLGYTRTKAVAVRLD